MTIKKILLTCFLYVFFFNLIVFRKARSRSRSVEREKPSNNSQAVTKTASPELPGPQIVKQSKELSSKENDVKPETPPTIVK